MVKQTLKNPIAGVALVGLYIWFLLGVVLGVGEGLAHGSEAEIVSTLAEANVDFFEERAEGVASGGLMDSVVWSFVALLLTSVLFVAEFVAIFTFRYLTWVPENVFTWSANLLILPPLLYATYIIYTSAINLNARFDSNKA